jgi:anti-sigma regulatory factor (Ser/Thr protein kinase)
VWVDFDRDKFTIVIQDYGLSFEFKGHNRYDVQAAMEGRQTGGFGLYIIQRSMDEISYQADPVRGNRLTLVKYLTG